MNVEIREAENLWTYPCWGRNRENGAVVRFTSKGIGTTEIVPSTNDKFYEYGVSKDGFIMDKYDQCENPFFNKEKIVDNEPKFPALYQHIHNEAIVLMLSMDEEMEMALGTLLYDPTKIYKPNYYGSWRFDSFIKLEDSKIITLSNGKPR